MLLPYVSLIVVLFLPPLRSTLFPYTTLFRSLLLEVAHDKDWKHASIYSIVLQSPVVRPDGDVPGYKHRFLIRNQDILCHLYLSQPFHLPPQPSIQTDYRLQIMLAFRPPPPII